MSGEPLNYQIMPMLDAAGRRVSGRSVTGFHDGFREGMETSNLEPSMQFFSCNFAVQESIRC